MRIVNRADAKATIRRRQSKPFLHPGDGRQHVAVTERNELGLGSGAGGLQDERRGGGVRGLARPGCVAHRGGERQAESARPGGEGFEDRNSVAGGDLARRGRAVSGNDDGGRAQRRHSPVELRRGQMRVERRGDSASRGGDDRQRGRSARERNGDAGVAI